MYLTKWWLIGALLSAWPALSDAALIGVDFGGPLTPINWTAGSAGPNPRVHLNLIDENGVPTAVDLRYEGLLTSDTTAFAFVPNSPHIPAHSNPLANIDGVVSDAAAISFRFSELVPSQSYKVWVFGGQTTTGAFADAFHRVTISGSGAPVSFNQDIANIGDLWINDQIGSNDPLESFALAVTASPTGELLIDVVDSLQGGGAPGSPVVTIAGLAIEAVPEPSNVAAVACALPLVGLAHFGRRRRKVG